MLIAFLAAMSQIIIIGPPPAGPPPPESDGHIFSGHDYPADAMKNRWEGTVVVDLLIGADGLPKKCSIVESSRHKLLDDTTCALIMRRAKFIPKTDSYGNPVPTHMQPPAVVWKLKH
ncbi:energy transducer TonB [Sphingomonas sabuli]|uniref:Energy transducer TonB n=1 Tax=Sphingomonas sabuli TaxID=2764186 RepID=A0A7G9KZW7_9SPHN|nr:energy transducer TonB [Sphingomonas sabuli]QNM81916.1 energy transducer TonB [Sphingomonas sabuli]